MNIAFSNAALMKKIWALLSAKERKSAVLLLGFTFIGMILETLSIGLIIPAVMFLMQDTTANKHPAFKFVVEVLGHPDQRTQIVYVMVALVCIALVKGVFLGFLTWRQVSFAFDLQLHLSSRLFLTYLYQPYAFHLQRNSAELIRNIVAELGIIVKTAIQPTITFLTESLVLISIICLMLMVQPVGTMIAAVVLGIASWGFYRFTRLRIFRWGEVRQRHEGARIKHLQQGLNGAKVVKLHGREQNFLDQYYFHEKSRLRVEKLQGTLIQLPRLWLEILAVIGLSVLVITMLYQGQSMVSIISVMSFFAAAAFRFIPGVNKVISSLQGLRYGVPVVNVVYEELKLEQAVLVHADRTAQRPFKADIQLKDVSFIYPASQKYALHGINLYVNKGELVGFIGSSGAGKSTLVDVILGLLVPSAGHVFVDGEDIHHAIRNWQDQIGYVPQSIYLTDDTIRRNVAFGLPDDKIDEQAVKKAITAAQLDVFINSLPKGLDTIVGERGVCVSGGQVQRVGIARALYHNPAVLVLDEATSSLDTETERGVMEVVNALQGEKTIMIVAHRLSTVAYCDRLYRLADGRIVEEGKSKDVLKKKVS
ncbi:MAG: ABC transporter ATP-binding protein [Deltaproteobacteria bacterium]|nr:ABC transporter ATP-binding protein [Deltaproteobacteria bacterium]